jgi:hypothetical protein
VIKILALIIFFIVLVTPQAHAQEMMYQLDENMTSSEELPLPTGSTTPTPSPSKINYPLPYPGVLPGSPVYTIKMARDKIWEILISDPVKKADFYVLQADKRLASSLALIELGDKEKGYSMLTKGLKYLEKSLDKAKEAREKNLDYGDIFTKIDESATKQKQEIEVIIGKSDKEFSSQLRSELKKAETIQKNASSLRP